LVFKQFADALWRARCSVEPSRWSPISGTVATINNDHASNKLRERLNRVIEMLQPRAQSSGRFYNPQDVATTTTLAGVSPNHLESSTSHERGFAIATCVLVLLLSERAPRCASMIEGIGEGRRKSKTLSRHKNLKNNEAREL